jgi:hypothetical protein
MKPIAMLPFALMLATLGAAAQESAAPAELKKLDTFEREVLVALQASHQQRRGIVVHAGGEAIGGVVTGIGPDVVALANREHGRILVRRERIDAVEAD